MSTRLIAFAAGFLALVTLPFWMHGDYYVNVVQPDSVLCHLRARS